MRKNLIAVALLLGGCTHQVGDTIGPTTLKVRDIPCQGRIYYWVGPPSQAIPAPRYADPAYVGPEYKPNKELAAWYRPPNHKEHKPTKEECTPAPHN